MSQKEQLEAHAAACRKALAEGRERPRWEGGSLTGANLTDANLTGASLTRAILTGASLTGASLTGANLTDADLTGAILTGAILTGAILTGAILTGADLTRASLYGASLTGANLCGARFAEGEARGRAIASVAGGYRWWVVVLEEGSYLLQYGCERYTAEWWRAQGPELSVHHGHDATHWEEGPAVAIAAAEDLLRGDG